MENHKIKIYSTPTCPYCIMAKNYFKDKGLEFEDINVAGNENAVKEMIAKSGQMGVPVVDIDDNIIIGFRPDVFEHLIN